MNRVSKRIIALTETPESTSTIYGSRVLFTTHGVSNNLHQPVTAYESPLGVAISTLTDNLGDLTLQTQNQIQNIEGHFLATPTPNPSIKKRYSSRVAFDSTATSQSYHPSHAPSEVQPFADPPSQKPIPFIPKSCLRYRKEPVRGKTGGSLEFGASGDADDGCEPSMPAKVVESSVDPKGKKAMKRIQKTRSKEIGMPEKLTRPRSGKGDLLAGAVEGVPSRERLVKKRDSVPEFGGFLRKTRLGRVPKKSDKLQS